REPVAETAVFRIERVCDNADLADLLHKWTIFGKGSDHDSLTGWSAIQESLGRAKRRAIDARSERVRIRRAGKIVDETGHVSFGSDDDYRKLLDQVLLEPRSVIHCGRVQ